MIPELQSKAICLSDTRSRLPTMLQDSEDIALLRRKNARLRAQLAITMTEQASAVQGIAISDKAPFDTQAADKKMQSTDFSKLHQVSAYGSELGRRYRG